MFQIGNKFEQSLLLPFQLLAYLGKFFNIHFGLVGTSDSFISNKELKKGILKNFPNMQVVEMEAAAIAQTCYQFGTKFIVCRSVSDKAEEGTRVTFDEFLQIAAVNSSILTTELIKKL